MKRRIMSMMLAILMVFSILPLHAFAAGCVCDLTDGVHWATCPEYVCPDCGTAGWHETCPQIDEGGEEDPDVSAACETCGNDPCTCPTEGENIWDIVDEAEEIVKIGFLDKGRENVEFIYDNGDVYTVSSDTCPDYLVLNLEYPKRESGETGLYMADTFDWDFYDSVLGYTPFIEPEYFVAVTPAAGLYATLITDGEIDLYKDPYWEEDPVTVDGAQLSGEYVVADFTYDYADPYSWFFRLVPDDSWPEGAEDYVWVNSEWLANLSITPTREPEPKPENCPICGKENCTDEHTHCGVCGKPDCTDEHIYCEICGCFNCGLTHEPPAPGSHAPATEPTIPANPNLPEGFVAAVTDGTGALLNSENGLFMGWNEKTSLVAWSDMDEVTYQWQIFVDDDEEGFWVDISGQTGKGILFSRAMLMSALDSNGMTKLRCSIRGDGMEVTTDPVSVTLDIPADVDFVPADISLGAPAGGTTFALRRSAAGSAPMMLSAGNSSRASDTVTVTVIINYLEMGGTPVPGMNPYRGNILAGSKFPEEPILLPNRPGYAPYRDIDGDRKVWTEDGYYDIEKKTWHEQTGGTAESSKTFDQTFSGEQTMVDLSFDVYYLPVKVNMGVRYFFQNVDGDGYTEVHSFQDRMRTGTEVTDDYLKANAPAAANIGFTRMVHNSEPVAADGSTIFECYYDRMYYLVQFELGGGYGVEPIYARYGAPVSGVVPAPTRPGYVFKGWKLVEGTHDGAEIGSDGLAKTLPASKLKYAAVWEVDKVNLPKYTVVYWRENADPNPDGSYGDSVWGTVVYQDKAAEDEVNGEDFKDVPDSIAVTEINGKDVNEKPYFTYNALRTDKKVVIKGDGSTLVNVYYTRNSYTIEFKGYGKCAICRKEEHVHTAECGEQEVICKKEEHTEHTEDCLKCGLTEHKKHTAECLDCDKPVHTEHTAECLECGKEEHTHTLSCYTKSTPTPADSLNNYYNYAEYQAYDTLKDNVSNPSNGNVYKVRQYYWNNYTYYNFFYINKTWYYLGTGNSYSDISLPGNTMNNPSGNTPTSVAATIKCGKEEHSHSDACYKDELHTHTDACYKDTLHTHTDECYNDTLHTHNDAEGCFSYSECDKEYHVHGMTCGHTLGHTHTGTCETDHAGGTTNNRSYNNTVYVITAKYNADISEIWPTYDVLQKSEASAHFVDDSNNVENKEGQQFRGWSNIVDGQETVSKRVNMTDDLCDTSVGLKTATATYSAQYVVHLFYMFESFNTTDGEIAADTESGEARREYKGKWYDSDSAYYQTVNANNNGFSQKKIMGMTAVGRPDPERVTGSEYNNFLYYDRNRYNLIFQNMGDVVSTHTVMYGQKLTNFEPTAEPPYPTGLEPGGYFFDGWYTTAACIDNTEADFSSKMPDGDLTLFAKWTENVHEVYIYRHYEYMQAVENEKDEAKKAKLIQDLIESGGLVFDEVTHGQLVDGDVISTVQEWEYQLGGITEGEEKPERVGFFYTKDNQKKAYSPQYVPVKQDLVVYAEWRGESEEPWRVEYVMANDTSVHVAEPTTGYARVGLLHTFIAKVGSPYNQLKPEYNVKALFPLTASHSMVMKAEEDKDVATNNVFQFKYVEMGPVKYTIRYVLAGTDTDLRDPEELETENAVVTVSYKPIPGNQLYVPDAFYKQLVLSVTTDSNGNYVGDDEKNVIIFEYTPTETEATYAVHHMLQKVDGAVNDYALDGNGGYVEDLSLLESGIGKFGTSVEITPKTIEGFTPGATAKYLRVSGAGTSDVSLKNGTYSLMITKEGAHLYIFYQRNSYEYEVYYYLEGTTTNTPGITPNPFKKTAPYGKDVTVKADKYTEDHAYMLVKPDEYQKTITIGALENKVIFYYTPIQYDASYVVATEGIGELSLYEDSANGVINFQGSKPILKPEYRFDGWYLDKECTVAVPSTHGTISEGNLLKPKYRADPDTGEPITDIDEYTFYAKFELLTADFTITKSGATDEDQVFVYRVTGGSGLSLEVTVVGNGSVTIANLPFGDYTVTQLNDWSWRYGNDDFAKSVTHKKGVVGVSFDGGPTRNNWLSGLGALIKNIFGAAH